MKLKIKRMILPVLFALSFSAAGQNYPTPSNDNVSLDEDTNILIDVLANDSDPDNDLDPASLTVANVPGYGLAVVQGTKIQYTPDPDFFGWDTFSYEISDQTGNTVAVAVYIIVNGINDAPTSADRSITINEDETYTFSGADFIYNDVDGDCFNGFKITSPLYPELGELLYDGNPVELDFIYADPELLQFVPVADTTGITEFDFRVVDDQGAESDDYTMTITILDVNDAPATADIVVDMSWNSIFDFTTELTYSDQEMDPMAGYILTSLPAKGALTYNNFPAATNVIYTDFSMLAYEPEENEHDIPYTSFTLLVEDARGAQSDQVMVTVNVHYEEYPIEISQGFSPNGDDINDQWYIRNIEYYSSNRIQIYNRWGSLVRVIEGYDNETRAWRGESENGVFGNEVTDGSYFYVISLGDGSGPLQGYVVLSR